VSRFDAYEDEMRIFAKLSDRDQNSVLAGRTSAVDDGLQEVAAFCRDTREVFMQPPAESTAAAHLVGIVAAARRVAQEGEGWSSRSPARRTRWIPFSTLRSRVAVTATGLAILAGVGGGAYAGVLPDPIQDKVANIARNVGLSLPNPRRDSHRRGVVDTNRPTNGRPEPAQQATHAGVPHDNSGSGRDGSGEAAQGDRGDSPQSNSGDGGRENSGAPEQSGSGHAPAAQSDGSAQDGSSGQAPTSESGQDTPSGGGEPTAPDSSSSSDQTVTDPGSPPGTSTESG